VSIDLKRNLEELSCARELSCIPSFYTEIDTSTDMPARIATRTAPIEFYSKTISVHYLRTTATDLSIFLFIANDYPSKGHFIAQIKTPILSANPISGLSIP
jgi:hypothetical protein